MVSRLYFILFQTFSRGKPDIWHSCSMINSEIGLPVFSESATISLMWLYMISSYL
ncbi:hypothetical protein FC59_GL001154 [Lactobacillus kitasatonis DSM 16761 = JCM 1039]|uniref:Uncharacterized protein n=1 Tax=Lactobacillus kitasatonis DSM 16761 = JCM 1039 TaxID=1423767 RepID=A0A0R1VDH8_9LACO|nr:hypothetical protein FC59_GL001154 [Lactobacillus kitasatonis DSM 16761 = JCM 1039]